jgi:hypothetical protein
MSEIRSSLIDYLVENFLGFVHLGCIKILPQVLMRLLLAVCSSPRQMHISA